MYCPTWAGWLPEVDGLPWPPGECSLAALIPKASATIKAVSAAAKNAVETTVRLVMWWVSAVIESSLVDGRVVQFPAGM
jgi:hypothetical protein